jgi:hypothetical protein
VRSPAEPPIIRSTPSARRFPPPWMIEEHNNACFIVKDATGQALGYFYFEDKPGRRAAAHPRRGAPHRRQHRQAAGVAAQAVRYQKLPAAFSGPARGILGRVADRRSASAPLPRRTGWSPRSFVANLPREYPV